MSDLTPAMKQFQDAKSKCPDCVIFFRMGDFYETFFEDAKLVAKELGITLTSRGQIKGEKIPLAGIPYHSLDKYLALMINKGYKVAICEQLEDPRFAKKVVKRDIVRIVTPGTIIEDTILKHDTNNYIMSIVFSEKECCFGFSLCDISTGEFLTAKAENIEKLKNEIARFSPTEILIPSGYESEILGDYIRANNIFLTRYEDSHFYFAKAYKTMIEHFNTLTLLGFGLENNELAVCSAGALLSYLRETQKNSLNYINKIQVLELDNYMKLNASTLRTLEILQNSRDNTQKNTLFETINFTTTSMGSRLMKKIIVAPLTDVSEIKKRLAAVDELVHKTLTREELVKIIAGVHDIERLISRVSYGIATPKDLIALKNSFDKIPKIKEVLREIKSSLLQNFLNCSDLTEVRQLIEVSIKDDPNTILTEGNIIKQGYNQELDNLKSVKKNAKAYLAQLENTEKEKTGIKTLKVRYNKVFGYYIEVSKSFVNSVPKHYIRKQTLVNAERFVTPELKEKEEIILNAEEKISTLEKELFLDVIAKISKYMKEMQKVSENIAILDVILSFARAAVINNYVRPEINDSYDIEIIEGRHPVVEKVEEVFIPNDVYLDSRNFMMIITGPNMAGKSTYMRQVALIVLMAQAGMFVPAKKAKIGVVDKIFTRVGARDELAFGQSTFMVEMAETANILNNATNKSLIILDEIGRGTSTFDGISIAWAVAEYIAKKIKAKTLFATHYHVLNELEKEIEGITNFNISVKEAEDDIIFLRKIIKGGTDKSYGIHVAKLAGLPKEVIERSKEIQFKLNQEDNMIEKIVVEKKEHIKKGFLEYKKTIQKTLDEGF